MTSNQTTFQSSGTIVLRNCADTPRDALAAVLADCNLSDVYMPSIPSTLDALKSALQSLYGGRGGLRIESLKAGIKGYGLMRVSKDTLRDLKGNCEMAAEYLCCGSFEQVSFRWHREASYGEESRIRDQIENERSMVSSTDVSIMLTSIFVNHNAIPLPGNGGVYWLPNKRASLAHDLAASFGRHAPRNGIYPVVASMDDASVRCAIAAVHAEAVKVTGEIQADLCSGLLEPSALASRMKRLQGLNARLCEYEESLNTALPDIHAAVATMQTAVLLAQAGNFDPSAFAGIPAMQAS